jgi:hypothetical protein
MDNDAKFSSRAFNDYYMALGIQVQHSVPNVHTQNSLGKSLIKRIKLTARPLLQNCNLANSCWGHAVLHAADLIQLRPTAYYAVSPIAISIWEYAKYFPYAKIRLRCIHTDLTA